MIEEVAIQNLVTSQFCNLDQQDSEYLLDNVVIEDLQSSYDEYSVYEKIGQVLNEVRLSRGRDIQITGWFIDTKMSSIETKRRFLAQFFNPLQKLQLTFKDQYIEGYSKTSVKFGAAYKDNNSKFCKFQVTIHCPYPVFSSTKKHKIAIPINPRESYVAPKGYEVKELNDENILEFEYTGDIDTGFIATFRTVENPTSAEEQLIGLGIKVANSEGNKFQTLSSNIYGARVLNTTTDGRGFFRFSSGELTPDLGVISTQYMNFIQIPSRATGLSFSQPNNEHLVCKDILLEYQDRYLYPKEAW